MNSASLLYKMIMSRLYGHLSENQISQFKLDQLTDYSSQTNQNNLKKPFFGKESFRQMNVKDAKRTKFWTVSQFKKLKRT